MKHTAVVTWIMLALFLATQVVGLVLLNESLDPDALARGEVDFEKVMIGGVELVRPETTGTQAVVLIGTAVLIGTILIFFLMKMQWHWFFKVWFFLAILACLSVAFSAVLPNPWPVLLALLLACWRIFKPDPFVHNFTELFIYAGLAIIFVPLLTLPSAIVMLLLISLYDAYAVWKSKHMVKLATFQTKSNMFAGMAVPYQWKIPKKVKSSKKSSKKTKQKTIKVKTAILGGGDMGFPLFFAGTVFKAYGFYPAFIIPICAAVALAYLFFYGKQDTFYPAMPYLSTGCLVGLGIVHLIV